MLECRRREYKAYRSGSPCMLKKGCITILQVSRPDIGLIVNPLQYESPNHIERPMVANLPASLGYASYWYFFTSTLLSTGSTVPLNLAMVNPYRSKIRGSQWSEKRSSTSIGFRSSTRPAKIVNIVEELQKFLARRLLNRLGIQHSHTLRFRTYCGRKTLSNAGSFS